LDVKEEGVMRTTTLFVAAIFVLSGVAAAQDEYYVNTADGFKVYFPAQPKLAQATWTSQQNFMLPSRVYSFDKGKEHYAVTVVDYGGIEKMGIERVKTCPAGAPLCRGTDVSGPGLWKHDVREALEYATKQLIQRDNMKLSDLTWSQHDMVEGNEVQLTNTVDGSRTYAYIAMHEMKLFIVEATVPKGYPPATLFQTSFTWVDKDGNGIRYQTMYNNEFHGMRQYPVPPHAGAAGGGRGGRGGAAQ
jgi:hypothetical protein